MRDLLYGRALEALPYGRTTLGHASFFLLMGVSFPRVVKEDHIFL